MPCKRLRTCSSPSTTTSFNIPAFTAIRGGNRRGPAILLAARSGTAPFGHPNRHREAAVRRVGLPVVPLPRPMSRLCQPRGRSSHDALLAERGGFHQTTKAASSEASPPVSLLPPKAEFPGTSETTSVPADLGRGSSDSGLAELEGRPFNRCGWHSLKRRQPRRFLVRGRVSTNVS